MATGRSLSPGEKKLLWAVSIFVVILGGPAVWRIVGEIDPAAPVIPTAAMPSPNAREYYLKAYDAFVPLMISRSSGRIGISLSEIDDWDNRNTPVVVKNTVTFTEPNGQTVTLTSSEVMALARKNAPIFATLRKGFQYEFREIPCYSVGTSLPDLKRYWQYLLRYRQVACSLQFDALARRLNGDWNGAVNDGLDGIRFGRDIPRGGITFGMFVGLGAQSICRSEIWQSIDHLNAGQARAATKRMEEVSAMHIPCTEALQEEQLAMQASLMEVFHKPNWRGELGRMDYTGDRFKQALHQLARKRQIMQSYTRYMDAAIAYAKLPYPAPKHVTAFPAHLLPRTFAVSLQELVFDDTLNETQNNLLTISFALRAYKVEHGQYPKALTELAPSYLHAIPADPFAANGTLLYKLNGNSYILYSVGPDGKDDGGKASADGVANIKGYIINPGSTGDIVAGVNIR